MIGGRSPIITTYAEIVLPPIPALFKDRSERRLRVKSLSRSRVVFLRRFRNIVPLIFKKVHGQAAADEDGELEGQARRGRW